MKGKSYIVYSKLSSFYILYWLMKPLAPEITDKKLSIWSYRQKITNTEKTITISKGAYIKQFAPERDDPCLSNSLSSKWGICTSSGTWNCCNVAHSPAALDNPLKGRKTNRHKSLYYKFSNHVFRTKIILVNILAHEIENL